MSLAALDLNGAGPKNIAVASGNPADPSNPAIQAVEDLTAVAALGSPGDGAYQGGSGSLIALLKAVLLQLQSMAVSPPAVTVTGSAALPIGTYGTVFVNNTSGAAATITLPPSPVFGQRVVIIDIAGNAAVHPIHVQSADGSTIVGGATFDLTVDYQSQGFPWTGTHWAVA